MSEWFLTKRNGELCVAWYESEPGGTKVRRRYRLGTADSKEAARRAPGVYAEAARPMGTRVGDLWKAYTVDMAGRAVVTTMAFTWKALKDRFGEVEGESVSIEECREHTKARRAAGISDGTIHTELGHLRMVLLWAAKRKLIAAAPAIERPTKPEPKEDYLTRGEVAKLLTAAKAPHIRLAIRLLMGTGARIEAALQLTWDRVDFGNRTIRLRNPFDRKVRKGRATVPMNDTLGAELREAQAGALTPYVIEWAGGQVKSIKKGLKNAGKLIGRPDVSPHMLRHSAGVWLAEDGHSMWEISEFLGHNNVKTTTKIYARFSPTHLRKLGDSLNT